MPRSVDAHHPAQGQLACQSWLWHGLQIVPHTPSPQTTVLRTGRRKPRRKSRRRLSKGYKRYLHSEAWLTVRALVIHRDGHRCRVCGRKGRDVHHVHYRTIYCESGAELVTLCPECHRYEHLEGLMAREPHWRNRLRPVRTEQTIPSSGEREGTARANRRLADGLHSGPGTTKPSTTEERRALVGGAEGGPLGRVPGNRTQASHPAAENPVSRTTGHDLGMSRVGATRRRPIGTKAAAG